MDASFLDDRLWHNGPQLGKLYNHPGSATMDGPKKQTLHPMVTGSSVIGVKFDGGVMIAADTLGSYGSLARYRNISRLMRVNDSTVLGAGGDYADFQFIKAILEQRVIDEECLDDGFKFTPKALFSWVTRIMYNRRTKINPLWNTIIIAGMQGDKPFLGYVDKLGVAYESDSVASGYGAYIAQPMMREALEKHHGLLSEAQARELIDRCLRVLYYRDARSWNRYEVAIVTSKDSRVDGPFSSTTSWDIAHSVGGYE